MDIVYTEKQIKQKEYYEKNKDKIKAYSKKYQQQSNYLKWLGVLQPVSHL